MVNQGSITARQFMIFIILFMLGNSIIYEPHFIVEKASRDTWIATLLAAILGLVLVWLYTKLADRFPGMTLVEYSEVILGKVFGKTISLLMLSFGMFIFIFTIFTFERYVNLSMLKSTPPQILDLIFVLMVIINVRLGLDNMARVAEYVFPWVLAFLGFLNILAMAQADFRIVQPILEEGITPVFTGAYEVLQTPYFQMVMLLMIYPFIKDSSNKKKSFYYGIFIGGILITVTTTLCILVLGLEQTTKYAYPTLFLARKMYLGDFFTRFEALLSISFLAAQVTYGSIVLYSCALNLAQVLKLNNYLPLTFPLSLISLAFVPTAIPRFSTFSWDDYSIYIAFVALLIPLLLLSVSLIRKKKFPLKKEGTSR